MKIGVLAIQGDFAMHQKMLNRLGVENITVRNPGQLQKCDGLIMPGGESTTFIRLLKEINLYKAISDFGKNHCIFGTCAGLITLSSRVVNSNMETMNLIDIEVIRNAYGRQIDSFIDEIKINLDSQKSVFEGVFIRAPKISEVGKGVIPLAYHKDDVVMVENKNVLVATFHPELTEDTRIHEYFLKKVQNLK